MSVTEPATIQLGQKIGAEALGTFILVFFGVGTAIVSGGDYVATGLAFGLIILVLVYAVGHISGCHINPAVTVALAATGKFAWKDVPGYVAAQVVGATAGALAIVGTLGKTASDLGLEPVDSLEQHEQRQAADQGAGQLGGCVDRHL